MNLRWFSALPGKTIYQHVSKPAVPIRSGGLYFFLKNLIRSRDTLPEKWIIIDEGP